ncbi:MAG: FAD:protein FMN transferase [Candidatus Omnitrophota bacterium]
MKKSLQFTVYNLQPKFVFLVSVLWFLVYGLCGCQRQPLHRSARIMMGTIVEVVSPDKRAAEIAFKEIERIENLLSSYKDDSEISRLDRTGKIEANPQTLFVIKKAGEFWQETAGAFDVTVAPLLELWGFRDGNYRVPERSEIKEALELIGFDKVKISGNIIEFKIKGMKMSLGAIAKGYAVDCALRELRLAGIKSALINAGGDIYCLGGKNGKPWRIAIKAGQEAGFAGYLELKDKAVATAGNYEQYFFAGDKRYSHILDPRTGEPADTEIASVTVIADDCLTADALATSIFVLGDEEGRKLAKRFNVEVKIYRDVQDNK